jgi:anti-sigma B factor antagonist
MNISIRKSDSVRIVDLQGDVDLGTSPDLRQTLFDLLGESPKLALNMKALRYIDSSGIATLIEVFKDAQRRQKEFVLFGISPAVQNVFRLTHVNRIFRIFDTEEEAVAPA